MAHERATRSQLRGLYVYKRLSMEQACLAMNIPRTTGNRWRRDAKQAGDDWESARAAVALGDENFSMLARQLLEDYLVQHRAVIDVLGKDPSMKPQDKATMLASLSDSFNKTMNSFRKMVPELNRHAVALDTLQRLSTFAQRTYPQHVPALVEMLEPFGEELAKAYG